MERRVRHALPRAGAPPRSHPAVGVSQVRRRRLLRRQGPQCGGLRGLGRRDRSVGPPRPSCAMIFVPPHGNMHLSALGIGFVALAWHTCDHRAPCDHRACSACSWHCALCPRDRQVCGSLAAACSWQTTWHGSLWPSGHASWRTELWSPHRVQCSLVLVAWQRPCPRDWPVLGSPTAACGALRPPRELWSPRGVQC